MDVLGDCELHVVGREVWGSTQTGSREDWRGRGVDDLSDLLIEKVQVICPLSVHYRLEDGFL